MILAQQTNRVNKNIIIPTPENAICVDNYETDAIKMGKPPATFIRMPGKCECAYSPVVVGECGTL